MSKMSRHKLNKLLKETVYSVHVPDVLDKAKEVPIDVTETKQVAKKVKPQRVALACVAMCCLIAICTCIGIFVPEMNNDKSKGGAPIVNEVTYVTVDINPSLTIKLVNGKVENISNNNKDGGIVLAGIDENEIIGKDFDTAINVVLKEATISGYFEFGNPNLEKEKNVVKIGVMDEDGNNIETLVNDIQTSVKDFFKKNNMFALIIEDTYVKSINDSIMEKFGVTLSKYELIKSLYKEVYNTHFVIEDSKQFKDFVIEYKDVRISDIYNKIESYSTKVIKDIYSIINKVLTNSHIEEFEQHIIANANKINNQLDEFIRSTLNKYTDGELLETIDKVDKESKDKLSESIKGSNSQIIDEFNNLIAEKSYTFEELMRSFLDLFGDIINPIGE